MIKKPDLQTIKDMDISRLFPLANDNSDNRHILQMEAGDQHYKLLAWISMQFDNILITEIGTLGGIGTIALSFNPKNQIVSFDIRKYNWGNRTPQNAEKKLIYEGYMDEVMKSTVIFYDAAHQGEEEFRFLKELFERGWKGMIIWDDIHLNQEMRDFWNGILAPKEDWTSLGHKTGTGVMFLK